MARSFPVLLLLLSLVLVRCTDKASEQDPVIAEVGDHRLLASAVKGIVNRGTSPEDSLRIVRDFAENWVRQQLLLGIAEKRLTQDEKDVEKQLQEYRTSLLIYGLESSVIREKLDTLVSNEEIETYYRENQGNFELKENIVRVLYVKVSPETPQLNRLRQLLRSDDDGAILELEEYCAAYAVNYYLDKDSWLYFNDLLKEIPIETYNQESFLRNNRYIELRSGEYLYFVRFIDFLVRESLSPLSLETERIRNILLNRRKLALVNEFQQEVFRKAMEEGAFKIHIDENGQ
ncbi:MAG TPA: hypothetical protein P5550_07020 [Bacteroidales bacterium]|nr:hypothetical protein [Bacteroidales bacterium]